MKKNILLVHSFLALPLLTTSFVFGMDTERLTYAQKAEKGGTQLPQKTSLKDSGAQKRERKRERKRQQQELLQQTPAIEENKKQETSTKDAVRYLTAEDEANAQQDLAAAKALLAQSTEWSDIRNVFSMISPEKRELNHVDPVVKSMLTTYYNPEDNALAQSTLSTEAKPLGFGFIGRITKSFNTKTHTILGYFKNQTFNVDNQDHLTLLNDAIIECADSENMQSLRLIAETCEKEYPSIRFSDTDLLFQSLQEKYKTQIKTSQWTLSNFDQEYAAEFNKQSAVFKEQIMILANAHKAMTIQLAQSYQTKISEEQNKIYDLQKLIVSTSALLGRRNSLKKITLFTQNPLDTPASSVEGVKNETEKRLSSLITNSNLPLIKAAAPTPK